MSNPTADTTSGPVTGIREAGTTVFRGIPYARPPTGDLRFAPPESPEPWSSAIDCTEFGPYAPQIKEGVQFKYWALDGVQDENCLSLNVWTPALDNKPRPVMVWIHGGAFVVGAAKRPVTDGAALSVAGDVVVVTLNYRLGALGWLFLDEVDPGLAGSGNNGLLDQIKALEWVRDNIANFGGDPSNVTLFGESAGGISVSVLLTVKRAKGLFHKAVAQSGAANVVRRKQDAAEATELLLSKAKAQSVSDLRALLPDEIIRLQNWLSTQVRDADSLFCPVMDDVIVEETPMRRLVDGAGDQVPLITGFNLDEYRYWLMVNPGLKSLSADHLRKAIRRADPDLDPDELIQTYRDSRPDLTDNQIGLTLIGDMAFRIPTIRIAEARASRGSPTYLYLFSRASQMLDGKLGAAHAMEIPFVFNTIDQPNVPDLIGREPERADLARVMQSAWIQFAHTGNPSAEILWPEYSLSDRQMMVFDRTVEVESDPYGSERSAWGSARFATQP